jgi:DNA-nicking Smr family endonuclease
MSNRRQKYQRHHHQIPSTTQEPPILTNLPLATHLEPVYGATFIDQTQRLSSRHRTRFLAGDAIERVLDLHGLQENDCLIQLADMLEQAFTQEQRTLHIIHGKSHDADGQPILKNLVHQALYHHPYVLAYASCPPNYGGTGALFVLLKNQRKAHV